MNLRSIPSITNVQQWFPKIALDGVDPVPGKPGFFRIETKHGVVDLLPGDFIVQYKTGSREVRRVNGGIIQGQK